MLTGNGFAVSVAYQAVGRSRSSVSASPAIVVLTKFPNDSGAF